MILVDSSAWVEYLRSTGTHEHERVRELLRDGAEIATTDVVVMEVLAGARSDAEWSVLRHLLHGRAALLAVEGPADYVDAAGLYRRCRAGGETVRRLADCLIAVVAMRAGAEILHRDRDFDAIARHAPLRIASWITRAAPARAAARPPPARPPASHVRGATSARPSRERRSQRATIVEQPLDAAASAPGSGAELDRRRRRRTPSAGSGRSRSTHGSPHASISSGTVE